ncbi:MAG: hypothetical protein KatS3mg104_0848 [Phycisphaerae bacterium]|jgi:hypothetical protein|nr:MAG: hypothetical protein KatS3mg104_0848 [Phycisphaerae bacterium]
MRKKTVLLVIMVTVAGLFLRETTTSLSYDVSVKFDSVTVSPLKPLDVRTRRLHMVRPDLIHYPLQYDTYC